MKKLLLTLVVLCASAGLTGCGTVQKMAQSDDQYDAWVDGKKVAAVENAARLHNVKVIWMQYPSKTPTQQQ
jgi:uncharacterized protein YceK